MNNDKAVIRGKVTAQVIDRETGLVKKESVNHNIVTNQGDALIADALSNTPARTKVDNASGVIQVGTGYVDNGKTSTLQTSTGAPEPMDSGYPQPKGAWSTANDNVTVYRATWEPGDLNQTGINEAELGNGTDVMAYAQITPAVDVTSTDILQVTWELTFLGA